VSACYTSNTHVEEQDEEGGPRHCVLIEVDDELLAAVDGWRHAHGLRQTEAIGQLIRFGLLSEIAKIYRLVSDKRPSDRGKVASRKERKPERSAEPAGQSLAN
jgi:hypothetical protein